MGLFLRRVSLPVYRVDLSPDIYFLHYGDSGRLIFFISKRILARTRLRNENGRMVEWIVLTTIQNI